MLKIILLLSTVLFGCYTKAQFYLSPVKINAEFNNNDSLISIDYTNKNADAIFFWIGNFVVEKLSNKNSYDFFASPIKNEIFFFMNNKINFLNKSSYIDTNVNFSSKKFVLLEKDSSFRLIFKLSDSELIKNIRNYKIYFYYSFFDYLNFSQFIIENKNDYSYLSQNYKKVFSNLLSLIIDKVSFCKDEDILTPKKMMNDLPILVRKNCPLNIHIINNNLDSKHILFRLNDLMLFHKSESVMVDIKIKK